MSKPDATPDSWNHKQAAPTVTAEQLLRRVHEHFGEAGVDISPSRVSRIVRRYLRESRRASIPDFDAWFMPHSDPTGEEAAYNVDHNVRKRFYDISRRPSKAMR